MRVILLASGDLWAGAEVMVCQLACGLVDISNINLLVVLLNKNKLADELGKLGVEVRVIEESKHSFFEIVRSFRRLIEDFLPDIIHSHRYKENILAWLSCIGRPETKLVATQHGMPETTGVKQGIKGRLRTSFFFRLLSCRFDRTVMVSEEMYMILQGSYGFSDKNMSVIHNGIEIPGRVEKQERQGLIVGSAGRLFGVKDYSLFVDIALQVIAQNNTIVFVLAGDGPQRSMLEKKVRDCGIDEHFSFLGHQDDMADFYKNLDVYINTSVHEGIPMSVLEAMSYGLPVVVPKVGGFPEIVHNNKQGFLIEGRDKDIYVDHLLQLSFNKNLRLKLGQLSRKRVVECFSREAMVQKYYNLYGEVLRNV